MTQLQTTPPNKTWLYGIRTTLTSIQTHASNLTSNTKYTTARSVLQTRSTSASDNQFITSREAKLLSKYVDRSSDTVYVKAIGGSTTYFSVKRMVDLSIAMVLTAFTLPILMMCALWVAIENAGSVLDKKQQFTSRLIQKDGQSVWVLVPFMRYEFLTSSQSLSSEFLKMTGLCALPSLFNVVRGDLCIVGSETITQDELDSFEDWQFLSLASKPGIISLSRISGKFSWLANDRTRQDVWYACNQSFSVDMKIFIKTFQTVIAI